MSTVMQITEAPWDRLPAELWLTILKFAIADQNTENATRTFGRLNLVCRSFRALLMGLKFLYIVRVVQNPPKWHAEVCIQSGMERSALIVQTRAQHEDTLQLTRPHAVYKNLSCRLCISGREYDSIYPHAWNGHKRERQLFNVTREPPPRRRRLEFD